MPEIKLVPTYMLRPLADHVIFVLYRWGKVRSVNRGDTVLLSPIPAPVNFKLFPGSSISPGEAFALCNLLRQMHLGTITRWECDP